MHSLGARIDALVAMARWERWWGRQVNQMRWHRKRHLQERVAVLGAELDGLLRDRRRLGDRRNRSREREERIVQLRGWLRSMRRELRELNMEPLSPAQAQAEAEAETEA